MERYVLKKGKIVLLFRMAKHIIIPWFILLFFFLTENQGKILARKQLVAQQNREDARIKKQIETAHKEMARLEKYFNVSAD